MIKSAGQKSALMFSTLFLLLHFCNARFLLVQTENEDEMSVGDGQDGEGGKMGEEENEERVNELPDDLKLLTDSLEAGETENGLGRDYYYCENNFCT